MILDAWRVEGFAAMLKREARPDDFIVPSREGKCRSLRHAGKRLREDLDRLGFAPSEQTHGFRRAMKTLAVANGAPEVWIERVIHNAAGGVAEGYLADDWPAMCRAVECIPVRAPAVVSPLDEVRATETSAPRSAPRVATVVATSGKNGALSSRKRAGWTGLELVSARAGGAHRKCVTPPPLARPARCADAQRTRSERSMDAAPRSRLSPWRIPDHHSSTLCCLRRPRGWRAGSQVRWARGAPPRRHVADVSAASVDRSARTGRRCATVGAPECSSWREKPGMTVRARESRGTRRWFVEIVYEENGKRARFRRDAAVQTLAGARAEDARRIKLLARTGRPFEVAEVEEVAAEAAITFEALIPQFFAVYAPSRLKPSTTVGYRKVVDAHLLPHFGKTVVRDIDARSVRRFDAELATGGMSAATRRNVLVVLRSILRRFAPEVGVAQDPPQLPQLPRVGLKVVRAMTEAEFRKVLNEASPALRRGMLLAGRAGLRAGEIRGLRISDVDLDAQELVVRTSICRGIEGPPKSGHERRVPLVRELAEELVDIASRAPTEHVSSSSSEREWSETGLMQSFRRACARAGIGHWRFHDLRHFFITCLFRSGAPAPVVQLLAGHRHLSVTQRYAHATADDLVRAMRRFDQVLESNVVGNSKATASQVR